MATLSSLGVGSGLDAENIVKSLVALERKPAEAVKAENNKLDTKVSTWGKIQSAFSSLQDAANALNSNDFWSAVKATSSDASAVGVSPSATSAPGSYNVTVQSLASSQYVASKAYTAGKTATVGQGTLTIQTGTYTANDGPPPVVTFNAKAAASQFNITIGPEDNTLEKIRDKINSSGAGVTASLVNDATGTRLVLRGATGAENAFKISVTENPAAPGLSALAYNASTGGTSQMTRTQAAANAQATINGLAVSSASNTMTDVVDGLTLQLSKVSATPINVEVSRDTDAIRKGIDGFVSAYNNVVSTIRVQTKYDEASKTAGPLQGDSTATGLLSQIRNLIGSSSGASSVFGRLSDIGLDIKTDGTLSVKSDKMNAAMSNPGELKKFFANSDAANVGNDGLSQRIKSLASQLLGTDGAINSRTEGIKSMIERNKDKIERIDAKATLAEARLRAQYTLLDNNMAKLNGLSSYVTAQLAALNKNS
ncbi:flagellar filament capping protein FliD [Aquabacterium sp.]|uniref:flagellar filament capping protein FliD n=1 Tax=Aquabacterium sp. TaxID=1872578 RepID=UPI00263A163A|nr:flagellar filament capping protein FliD [Aquabacterium sp.]MDD2976686.1 flagellar filament capping protein FliD [Aquabacterium sp.]